MYTEELIASISKTVNKKLKTVKKTLFEKLFFLIYHRLVF